ncbi:MAG: MBL fold metallo-hydrolase [Candidatus Methanoperedens sp.]|nr:MBL fold metallo-hydrolase [Candidatus Methanoperedens sp.]
MENPEPLSNGGKFKNPGESSHGFADFLKWVFNRKRAEWPKWIESQPGAGPVSQMNADEIRVTYVNHSTFLIQADGMNILTDPIWSTRAGPLSFIGTKRIRAPGIKFEELPPVDAVLVSHNHYDHMDMPTLKTLEKEFSPLFVVGLGNKKFLEKKGLKRVEELNWCEKTYLSNGSSIFFVPAQHFSGRTPWNINKSLWGGFMIESSQGQIYYAGDTGFGNFFENLHANFSNIKVALLPIGAYEPRWFMSPVHMNPEDAVRAHQILKPNVSIGAHFGTFHLADEGVDAPKEQLEATLRENGIDPKEFIILNPGESVTLMPNDTRNEGRMVVRS